MCIVCVCVLVLLNVVYCCASPMPPCRALVNMYETSTLGETGGDAKGNLCGMGVSFTDAGILPVPVKTTFLLGGPRSFNSVAETALQQLICYSGSLSSSGSSRPKEFSSPTGSGSDNLRTKIIDFRRFHSSRILILRGRIPGPRGNFPESLSRPIFSMEIISMDMYVCIYIYIYICVLNMEELKINKITIRPTVAKGAAPKGRARARPRVKEAQK